MIDRGFARSVGIQRQREIESLKADLPGKAEARFTWEDANPLRGEKPSYYYVRVRQQDGQMAWASPIWASGCCARIPTS